MPLILTVRKLIVALAAAPLLAALAPAPTARAHVIAATPRADRPSAAELNKRITAAARQLEVLVERYNEAQEDLRTTRTRTANLGGQLGPLTRDLARRQELMGGLVARTYQRTRSGPTIALFATDEPDHFVEKLLVLHQLAAQEQRAARDLNEAREQVNDTRRTLNALAEQQRRMQTQLGTRKAAIEGEIVALRQIRAVAYGDGSRFGDDADMPVPDYVPGPAGRVVAFALDQLGKPYRWGAEGPDSYDCSGLTLAAWRAAGVGLPHNAARQFAATAQVSRAQLRPGDLVFFYGPISHVGLYIGGGKMIHAPEYGENVRVSGIDSQPIHGFGRPS